MNEKVEKLMNELGNAFDGVWEAYCKEVGINSGDIDPLTYLQYGNCIKDIAELIYSIGEQNKKKKFKITIEEMVSEDFEVEAETIEEAMKIAEDKYYNGEFVLEPGNLVCKQMMADDGEDDVTEWVEF